MCIDVSAGGLQLGGGINDQNAKEWLDAGASKVSNKFNFSCRPVIIEHFTGDSNIVSFPWSQVFLGKVGEDIVYCRKRQTCS